MSTHIGEYRREQQLNSVRLLKDSNLSGTYYNGSTNNGVGARFTTTSTSLTIDSVIVNNGDRICLQGQTSGYQNGIYKVTVNGIDNVVLTRTDDFQTFDQMKPGYYFMVEAGTIYDAAMFVVIEPQVQTVGRDSILFETIATNDLGQAAYKNVTNNALSKVVSFDDSLTPDVSAVNNIAIFSDFNGTIKDSRIGFYSQSDTWAGGGTSHAFNFAGMSNTQTDVWAVILASTNNVSITKVVAGNSIVTISFSADPGANTTVRMMGMLLTP